MRGYFLPFRSFFSSLAKRRSTFFTSSAGGSFSGTMPRSVSILRTAALLSICSLVIDASPCKSLDCTLTEVISAATLAYL